MTGVRAPQPVLQTDSNNNEHTWGFILSQVIITEMCIKKAGRINFKLFLFLQN